MVYTYTPTYYTSLHDSITTLCKTVLPFSFKKRRLPAIAAAEQKLSKLQSDNLKWQQDSFHQILNLMGLWKEGILDESEVVAFRSHLLDTLIASGLDYEQPVILRDKLIFLQELLYAKCITDDEYHASKRPLLQRLAVQGAEIEARDVILGAKKAKTDDEWSDIDLKDEHSLISKESLSSKNKSKHGSAIKQIKGAASVFNFVSSQKHERLKADKDVADMDTTHFGSVNRNISPLVIARNEVGLSQENPFWDSNLRETETEARSILMSESLPPESVKAEKRSGGDKVKKKSGKKQWGFDGFKKWKKNDSEDETAPLSVNGRSDGEPYLGRLVESPIGEGPDTKEIKRKLHADGSPSDFFVDKVQLSTSSPIFAVDQVLGDKIKKELSRIQTELSTTNLNAQFSNDQIEAISTRLPVDKADLKKFFPKTWCDRYGDVVLDVVRKEFKDHVGETKILQNAAREKQKQKPWTTFDDDDENCHPNLFVPQVPSFPVKQSKLKSSEDHRVYHNSSSTDKWFRNNPFFDDLAN
ncbi:hypothetical protein RJ639_041155 [Escallonia herrerae]|uniref:Uncharacterized protein n=1 Tax=Escallonia herrerae TaxID=1293975 RepID=A0AA88WHW3_9ASTE|nr:hypothetical protein RJ639_041155 [Escallonia herrerae]